MSKIVQAVNAMLSNREKIAKVCENEDEYYFVYGDKYKWSIRRGEGGAILLYFYPGEESFQYLSTTHPADWSDVKFVVYKDADIGTKEAKASFLELLNVVQEKLYGVDAMLDEIIKEDEIPW